MQQAGVLEKIEWPDWPSTDKALLQRQRDASVARLAEQEAFLTPFVSAQEEYDRRFADKFGKLPPAFVRRNPDGTSTLFLQAHDAYAILNYFRDEKPIPEDDFTRQSVVGQFAFARHEYAHTQRKLTVGPHGQLGLLLEERKAELVSGDKHGYKDVKDLITDLSFVSDVNILNDLEAALKQEDALSVFVVNVANKLGLRDTLMLMLGKPLPYDKRPEHARRFVNLGSIRRPEDASVHDAIVRDSLARKGDANIRRRTDRWIETVLANGTDPEFLTDFFFGYRRSGGLTHGTAYMEQALDRYLAHQRQDDEQER